MRLARWLWADRPVYMPRGFWILLGVLMALRLPADIYDLVKWAA